MLIDKSINGIHKHIHLLCQAMIMKRLEKWFGIDEEQSILSRNSIIIPSIPWGNKNMISNFIVLDISSIMSHRFLS